MRKALLVIGLLILAIETVWLFVRPSHGIVGLTGETGDRGSPGMGIQGLPGHRGLTGADGPRGETGADGAMGLFADRVISQTVQTQGGVPVVLVAARSESSVIQLGVVMLDTQTGTTHLGAGKGPACGYGYRVLTYDFHNSRTGCGR